MDVGKKICKLNEGIVMGEDGPKICSECGGLGDDHDDDCKYGGEDDVI